MADVVSNIVGAITKGIQWIRAQYRKFKVWLAEEMIKALEKGWTAALTIAGLVTASIVVGYVWQIMMQNAVVKSVMDTLKKVGDTVKRFTALLQLDLVIGVVNLAVLLNEKLYAKLAPLYDELGSFAEELELDISYISTFVEVDRAILTAAYTLTDAGFLKAAQQYAIGLSDWVKKLRENMMRYAENPQLIFTDIQADITAARVKEANEQLGRIWGAINFSGDWIREKGEALFTLATELDAQVKAMPPAIQEAIAPWYNDAIARVKKFQEERWEPFIERYDLFADTVNDAFAAVGMDIEEIKRRIDDPLDWVRSLLALPPDERATLESTLKEVFGIPTTEEVSRGVKTGSRAAVAALEEAGAMMGSRGKTTPGAVESDIGILDFTPAPATDTAGALRETGETPWPAGQMAADGRGWYVG